MTSRSPDATQQACEMGAGMDSLTKGSCLCGAVRFEISGPFDAFFLCHCGRCRKDSGSAHAANIFSAGAQITWIDEEDQRRTFRLPETRHAKSFCTTCGSALPYEGDDGVLVIPAGSLDTPIDIRPNAHLCMASRAEWDVDLAQVPALDGLPG